ncbi:MAG TPA: hypothetical protein DCL41_05975 [Bdellovibrionales bacterium]|nr:hypothetical protein [Pseudobdellovibrionaceae bacterium]HAG91398.1 hypothetical protein [Bdellovibrionales bacterium]|tara:strand:- start:333 stop:971 length:639 start_codon:yes stop_codon:yes gene_type:complete
MGSEEGRKSLKGSELFVSSKEYFSEELESALKHFGFDPHPLSKTYLVDLLERFMLPENLYEVDQETGKYKRDTLAEMYLRAQNENSSRVRMDLFRRLGDTSLYISGFFGDSLNRKIVDIDYYVDMGGVAYGSVAREVQDSSMAEVYGCFSTRFVEFVDVLTFISQKSQVQTDQDLLRLYDRYLATGSKLAEDQLLEKGVLNSELSKAKGIKQ